MLPTHKTHPLFYPPPPAVNDDGIHEGDDGLEDDSQPIVLDPLNPEAYAFSVDL